MTEDIYILSTSDLVLLVLLSGGLVLAVSALVQRALDRGGRR